MILGSVGACILLLSIVDYTTKNAISPIGAIVQSWPGRRLASFVWPASKSAAFGRSNNDARTAELGLRIKNWLVIGALALWGCTAASAADCAERNGERMGAVTPEAVRLDGACHGDLFAGPRGGPGYRVWFRRGAADDW